MMASLELDDGTRLDHELTGTGDPALVFVHGWCSHRGHWSEQERRFSPRHRVVTVDRRGHGTSAVTPDGYEPGRHAADLAELLDHLGVADAVLVAHAGGGPTTLTLARSRPDLVAAMVLVDTVVRPSAPAGSGLAALVERLAGPDGRAVLEELYLSFFVDPRTDAAREAVAGALRMPTEVVVAELASLDLDTEALAHGLHQPVRWVSVEPADRAHLSGVFADVSFEEISGSGHFPQLEAPAELNEVIEAFVATRGSAPRR